MGATRAQIRNGAIVALQCMAGVTRDQVHIYKSYSWRPPHRSFENVGHATMREHFFCKSKPI